MNLLLLIISQVFGLTLGLIKSLVLPKYLTIEDFALWQIYLLYVGYITVFSFGFNDGLLVRYGKFNLSKLPVSLVGKSIKYFMSFIILFTVILLIFCLIYPSDDKKLLFIFISLNIPLVVLNGIFLFLLQSTNQIKKYSFYSVIDKLIMLITLSMFVYFGFNYLFLIIIIDMLSRLLQIFLMYLEFKKLFNTNSTYIDRKTVFLEIKENISRGLYILVSNLISMLLFGFSLFVIERFMTLKNYSMYSLGISITNILLLFINAISVVVFPYLSRLKEDQVMRKASYITNWIVILSIIICNIYVLITFTVENFLDKYVEILLFMPFIFLSIVLQIKFSIIFYPMVKILQYEKKIFSLNLVLLLISIVFTIITVVYFHSLLYTSIVMYIILYLRNYFSNKIVFKINYFREYIELISHVVFLIVVYRTNTFYVFSLYSVIAFLLIKKFDYERKL